MVARAFTIGALAALGYSKAIITNNCRKDVYIWSVPGKEDYADNLSISPGKRYEEPWRSGTAVNPGVAIKVSTKSDGIHAGKSEIDFQYDIDESDSTKIWINLATVRGNDFDTATLNTCQGGFEISNVAIQQCSSTDDIELVLCGSERTVPSQDSTPVRVISNCIRLLTEHDDTIRPRTCSGRVVGPKRMPRHIDEQEDQWLAEDLETVPLKTVMRLEAAKHAASQHTGAHDAPNPRDAATPNPGTFAGSAARPEPFCDLLKQAWPNALCDERMAEHNARLFYEDNCGPKTTNMFPGASCEAIRHQMKQIFPEVVSRGGSYLTMCITPYYSKFAKYWGSDRTVKEVFNHQGVTEALLPGISWTSDEEFCQKPNRVDRPIVSHGTRCVRPFCRKGPHLPGDCSDVEDELEKLSQDAGWKIDWTSDEDVCLFRRSISQKRPVGVTQPEERNHRNAINAVSAQAGRYVDWTTDGGADAEKAGHVHDQAAPNARSLRANPPVAGSTGHRWNDIRKVCITTANEKLGKYWGAEATEEMVRVIFPDVLWTENLDDCSPQAIAGSRAYHHKLIDNKQEKEKKCVTGCLGKTCKRLKKELNNLSKDVGQNWSWTDDEVLCAGSDPSATDTPFITTCHLNKNAINRLSAYWGEARDNIIQEIFPFVELALDDDACDLNDTDYAKNRFRYQLGKRKRERRCVKPYCEPFQADCSDVEDQLEEVSKNIGYKFDWTTDDDTCEKDAIHPMKYVPLEVHTSQGSEFCMPKSCATPGLSLDGCWWEARVREGIYSELTGVNIKYSIDGPACHGARATGVPQFPQYIMASRRPHKICRRRFCRHFTPLDNGCLVGTDESRIRGFAKEALLIDIEFTDDDVVCGSTLGQAATFEDPTTYAYNASIGI